MKILHIISSLNRQGSGPAEGLLNIALSNIKAGHQVEILTLDSLMKPLPMNDSLKIHFAGPAYFKYRYAPKLSRWLLNNSVNYDALIIEGLWQFHSFISWKICCKLKIPYYVYVHGMLSTWFKFEYPIKHLKKSIYWFLIERKVLRDARYVLYTTEEEKMLARLSFKSYSCLEKVIGYGISKPVVNKKNIKEEFFKKFPGLDKKRLILFLGRIHTVKGCDILIEAFAKIAFKNKTIHLVIAGQGDDKLKVSLKKQVSSLNLANRITWAGVLSGDLKWGAIHCCEVFCLPSHQENFGVAVVEALACGKPVLISNKVNIWREISASSAGFVDDDSIPGTINNLNKWLAMKPNDLKKMSLNAKKCYSNNFNSQQAADNLINIIKSKN